MNKSISILIISIAFIACSTINKTIDGNTRFETISTNDTAVFLDMKELNLLNISSITVINPFKSLTNNKENKFKINFNEIGTLQNFEMYHSEIYDEGSIEYFNCNVQHSHFPIIRHHEDYSYNIGENDTLINNYRTSPSAEEFNLNFLSDKTLLPFIGKNGYAYYNKDIQNMQGNTIKHHIKEWEGRNSYKLSKHIKTDSVTELLFELKNDSQLSSSIISRRKINNITKDTTAIQYYYYGDNPLIQYTRANKIEGDYIDDNEKRSSNEEYDTIYYKDTIYNKIRWLGYTKDDFSEYHNELKRAYDQVLDEGEILKELFKNENVCTSSKNNFLINGKNGYEYLLEAFNNKKIMVYESPDNHDDNIYKKQKEVEELNVLPKKIIIQVSLTDFWFVQLTE